MDEMRAKAKLAQARLAEVLAVVDALVREIDALTDPPPGSTVLTGIPDPMVTVEGTCPCGVPFLHQFPQPLSGQDIVFVCPGCGHKVRFPTVRPLATGGPVDGSRPLLVGEAACSGGGYRLRSVSLPTSGVFTGSREDWDDARTEHHRGQDDG